MIGLMGITSLNFSANLYSYSLIAATSLDLAASAAGRIDTEAARYLRMAQNMMRTRLDIFTRQATYGPINEKNGKKIGLSVAENRIEAFDTLNPISSEDAAVMKQSDNTESDLGEALLAITTPDGKTAKIDGYLIRNLAEIMKAEKEFYRLPLEKVIKPIGDEQYNLMIKLKIAAATIADFIRHAIEILRDKLAAYNDLYVCTSCGRVHFELVEQCELCEASQSLIVRYPFQPKGEIARLEREIYASQQSK